jgi:threonine synthase
VKPDTVATAIKIGNPVNHAKAVRAIKLTNGVVESVTDAEILEAKAMLDREGVGAEPASAATLAGLLKLRSAGVICESDSVVCVLTGHMLKDPDATIRFHTEGESLRANKPVTIDPTIDALKKVL